MENNLLNKQELMYILTGLHKKGLLPSKPEEKPKPRPSHGIPMTYTESLAVKECLKNNTSVEEELYKMHDYDRTTGRALKEWTT